MKSAAFLGAQLTVNALTGYAFQKVFAYYYGASVEKSIFDIAFAVPTMLIYLSGLGLTHAIVVSLFTRLRHGSPDALDRVFSSLTNASLGALVVITSLTALFVAPLAGLLAPGLSAPQQHAVQTLILWMLPLTLTFGISSYLSAVALAWGIPVGQEILLLVGRLAVIAIIIADGHAMPLTHVAAILLISTLAGVALQWAVLVRLTGLRYRPVCDLKDPTMRDSIHQLGGFLFVAIAAQVASAYGRRVGTLAGENVVALLGFASSLIDPLSVILGKVLGFQIGQPLAARLVAKGAESTWSALYRVLWRVLALGCLVAVVTAAMAFPLVSLFFGGGQFEDSAVRETARYVRIMAIGLPAAITLWIFLYPLLGAGRHLAASMYVGGHVLQILAIRVLFGHVGGDAVAWGYSICVWVQAAGAWLLLAGRKRVALMSAR